jgi:hypothetical protein
MHVESEVLSRRLARHRGNLYRIYGMFSYGVDRGEKFLIRGARGVVYKRTNVQTYKRTNVQTGDTKKRGTRKNGGHKKTGEQK